MAPPSVVPLSAQSGQAVERMATDLAAHLRRHPRLSLDEVALTRAVGRPQMRRRWGVVATDLEDLLARLSVPQSGFDSVARRVAFTFPGQGLAELSLHPSLLDIHPRFSAAVERCARYFEEATGEDLIALLDPASGGLDLSTSPYAQPALFAVQYACAELWSAWGVEPAALLGHSVGEYTAACRAGVWSLEDALKIVVERGRLLHSVRGGGMLAVVAGEADARALAGGELAVAAVNGSEACVLSGRSEVVERAERACGDRGIRARRLRIDYGFHSELVEPVIEEFVRFVARFPAREPSTPLVSNVSGDWAVADEVTEADYWGRHLRHTVRFGDGVRALLAAGCDTFIECGAGAVLTRLIGADPQSDGATALATLDGRGGADQAMGALARAWELGIEIDWARVHEGSGARRVRLPGYPFDRRPLPARAAVPAREPAAVEVEMRDWRAEPRPSAGTRTAPFLVIGNGSPLGSRLAARLREAGCETRAVGVADLDAASATAPAGAELVDLRLLDEPLETTLQGAFERQRELLRAVSSDGVKAVWTVTSGSPVGESDDRDLYAVAVGESFATVAPQEHPGLAWRLLHPRGLDEEERARSIAAELLAAEPSPQVRLDGTLRSTPGWRVAWPGTDRAPLRDGGIYLITGGLGLLGSTLAVAIAEAVRPKLVLAGRRGVSGPGDEATVARLRALGAEVEVVRADLADPAGATEVLARSRALGGSVEGIVHAAGMVDVARFPLMLEADEGLVAEITAAKARGALALADALVEDPAFVLLCSSASVVLGGLRYGPYVAANAVLDGLARRERERRGGLWTSVAWDALARPGDASGGLGPEEVKRAFGTILRSADPNLAVTAGGIDARLTQVRALLGSATDPGPAATRPGGEVEPLELVRRKVEDLLGVPVGDQEDLVARGVDSLMLMQLLGFLRGELGSAPAVAAAFRNCSIAGIAGLCEGGEAAAISPMPGSSARADQAASLTPPQQRLWIAHQLQPHYNVQAAWRISGIPTAAEAERLTRSLLERHDALRLSFEVTADGPVQRAVPATAIEIDRVRWDVPADERLRSLTDLARKDAGTPFDLEAGPPIKVRVAELSIADHVLVLTAHHLLIDAWSVGILEQDLRGLLEGRELPLSPFGFLDHAREVDGEEDIAELGRLERYWLDRLAGIEVLRLPVRADAPAEPEGLAGTVVFRLEAEFVANLRAVARAKSMTLYMMLIAALAVTLARWSDRDEVSFGTNVANRGDPRLESVVGFFVNAVMLRFGDLRGASVGDCLDRVRTVALDAFDHQEYPFSRLVQRLNPPRTRTRTPLIPVMFTFFEDAPDASGGTGGPTLERLDLADQERMKFDYFSVNVESRDGGLDIHVVYAEELFEEAAMDQLGLDLIRVLEFLQAGPDERSIDDLDSGLERTFGTRRLARERRENKFQRLRMSRSAS